MLTWFQARTWRTSEAFWAYTASVSPLKPAPHLALGLEYQAQGRFAEAKGEYAQAYGLSKGWPDANSIQFAVGFNLAKMMAREGRTSDAYKLLTSMEAPFPQSVSFIQIEKLEVLMRAGVSCQDAKWIIGNTEIPIRCG